MKRRTMVLSLALGLSLVGNVYFISNQHVSKTFTPQDSDLDVLAEITQIVTESDEYKEIAERENVYAIKPAFSRFNVAGPTSIFRYEIQVKTDEATHVFTCTDQQCTNVEDGERLESEYENRQLLLFKNQE